jgi:hypothetical protein
MMFGSLRKNSSAVVFGAIAALMSACAPATSPTPAFSGAAWPPQNYMRVGQSWSVEFQLGQSFAGRITGKDSDGDWTGTGNGGQTLFSFSLRDGAFVFQVLERAGGASWYCALPDSNSVSGSGQYRGIGLYTANRDAELQNLRQSCIVNLR